MQFSYLTAVVAMFLITSFVPVYSADDGTKDTTGNKRAIFAGGCFWCMEPPFDQVDGVLSTISGYTGGHQDNPSYKQVSSGSTGHTEAIEIVYDPDKVSYQELLDIYWVNIDPLNSEGQFCDYGSQYRSEIFYLDDEQKKQATATLEKIKIKLGKPVATKVTAAQKFYPAEKYHQDYYQVNPVRYNYYRWACGRDARLKELWGEDAGH